MTTTPGIGHNTVKALARIARSERINWIEDMYGRQLTDEEVSSDPIIKRIEALVAGEAA